MKKRLRNIIFYIIMLLCLIAMFYFNNDFKDINLNSKNYYKYKDYKYVSIDLTKAKLNRLSYELNNKKYNIYTVKIKDYYLLVYLNENTALTKKVNVMKYNDDKYSQDIKISFENDSEGKISYRKGYYSNISYNINKKILDIKYYFLLTCITLCVLLLIINIILSVMKK